MHLRTGINFLSISLYLDAKNNILWYDSFNKGRRELRDRSEMLYQYTEGAKRIRRIGSVPEDKR